MIERMTRLLGLTALFLAACGSDGGSDAPGAAGAAGSAGSGTAGESSSSECSAAREQLIGAIDQVSTGAVTVLSDADGVTRLYVDATAGGPQASADNPWIFLSLADFSKVEVTDVSATSSSAWDLALKRPLLYTNSGDGGPGEGGAVLLDKELADVTSDDAVSAEFVSEKFFDDSCTPIVDPTNAASTSFTGWYDYDGETHALSPHPGTWLVHGARGKAYKLRVVSYYGTADGGTGMAGGGYLLEVGAL